MGKNLNYSRLLDFYGACLTDKQNDILSLYYNEDLSLSEISEIAGISRQGVMDIIRRGESQLDYFDSKLHLTDLYKNIDSAIECIQNDNPQDAARILNSLRM